ncbi:ATPase, AAA family protein [Entamoeba histolytica HM-1:IMSS-B]|uniref:ATPase, AAA family protein n=6 Tax=Entamoeba histolytica TaxID=5759 RepID=C4M767_ENTH1|nr:ATPase, AAA family protein [Entamoeba histolytica HM-1:IMSS]EMD46958.1 atpase AAA family protein [Entamoeba histolytica KU27]EMH76605.1 ATPase, AAA family protein [Entamoeba histolytica HM-1:IMSS-B]EMS12123.1 ATPase, AAA family protein [Entamoeba histolytica HM-3:IMSS]ENY61071.1 ATPase, AAA family protein, putative [Entamoeba histolytica HM-1:IMSS-A]GAT97358.1 ATPase AAA family protein [Entamoeba histolytica]|eukprot:XP_655028.1 ATPase, AAA family protein [Entamoeba histolytica HM-1:IMSS]
MIFFAGDKDSGKVRLTRKDIDSKGLFFDESVIVTIQNNKQCICRVSGFNDIIEEGCSVDPFVCINQPIERNEIKEIKSIEKIKEIEHCISVNVSLCPINNNEYSFSNSKNVDKYLLNILNGQTICIHSIIQIHILNIIVIIQSINGQLPNGFFSITKDCSFSIQHNSIPIQQPIGYEFLLEKIYSILNDNKTLLLEGEHGSGKTLIAKYCSYKIGKQVYYYNSYQIIENNNIVNLNVHNCIIILDDIDELIKDYSLLLIHIIKQLKINNNLIVCTTSQTIPNIFKSNELITYSLRISPPDQIIRYKILDSLKCNCKEVNEIISKKTVGYLPKDLLLLQNDVEAQLHGNETTEEKINLYLHSMTFVTPSVLVGSETDFDKLHWDDIGGLENVKKAMIEAIEWPMTHSKEFKKLGIRPSHGVLLYGPSGCAKTSIVRATATMLNTSFITLSSATIYSPYVGDAEASVRDTFKRARAATPCIIFIDEIDTVVGIRSGGTGGDSVRDRVLSTLLNEMDGIEEVEGVILVAASNRKELIDPALLRPGRFDCLIEVPKPDQKTRIEIFKVALKDIPIDQSFDFELLAQLSEGKSGADIKWIVSEACTHTLRNDINATSLSFNSLIDLLE